MSAFERYAVQRLIDQAVAAGIAIPDEVNTIATHVGGCHSYAGTRWADEHPDDAGTGCCWGEILNGPSGCNCWTPVFAEEQQPPRPPAGPEDLPVQPAMCGDCAFRKGSPERAEAYTEQALLDLPNSVSTPFFCHDGMRRPLQWRHPDGRIVPGSPDDWHPGTVPGTAIPYRANGSPALLCAGWAARAVPKAVTP